MTSNGDPNEIVECSSPPCMLEEVHSRTGEFASLLPAHDKPRTWTEVKAWRSSKRLILIEQRIAISAADRADHSTRVSTILGQS